MPNIKKQIRNILFFTLLFLFFGCQKEGRKINDPEIIVITNAENKKVGVGIYIKDDLFLTADHLLGKSKELYHNESRIKVIARDFSHDLLLFKSFPKDHRAWIMDRDRLKVGEDQHFFWHDGDRRHELSFLRQVLNIEIEQTEKNDVLVFFGDIEQGFSGSPFFDANGNFQGILIGGHTEKNYVFGINTDVISNFITENVDE